MKKHLLWTAGAVVLALVGGLGWAQAARKPVNRKCPLKPDSRVDPAQTVVYNGKVIGLCCSDCTDKWKKNPAAYASAVKEDAHLPIEPEGFTTLKDALDAAKVGGYVAIVFFADKAAASQALLKVVSDPALEEEIAKCAYVRVEYKKDSEDAKKLGVTSAPTLLLIDATGAQPKELKKLTTATPKTLLKDLQDAAKKMEKK
jgi:hypothetical protein